ncbi:WD repeat-containing protein 54-like [Clavelina lepadiformis]|uniref:WD repeat-containing protein 54-like n=1 Tax=Clavelina lepadiformis TaxID=159417 RepID=UPI004042939A
MYEKVKSHLLEGSASSLYNNLDVFIEDSEKDLNGGYDRMSFATVSKTNVSLVHYHRNGKITTSQVTNTQSKNCTALQARWCSLGHQDVLVVANFEGFLVYDSDGQLKLFWYSPSSEENLADGKSYCRAITCVSGKFICVGRFDGKVMVITANKNTFSVCKTLHGHSTPITATDGLNNADNGDKVDFISADDSGTICTYRSSDEFEFVAMIPGSSVPCTSIKLLSNGLIAGGFLTGHIRIFDPVEATMLSEITAHTRAVSCMDATIDKEASLLICGSEDSFIRVWKVTRDDTITVTHEWSASIRDIQICGAKFCDPLGQAFAVSGYDSKEIMQFSRVY